MINIKRNSFFSDASFLILAKILTLLIPILLYPYLYGAFGLEIFSDIVFKLAVIELVSALSSYGFELTGVYFCSKNKHNKQKISLFI